MITPKGFVLLGSKSGGMRAGACERGHASGSAHKAHKSKPTCRASCSGLWLMVPCRVLHRAVVFRGVVSLSSVDYVYVLAGAQGEHKVGRASWEGEAINNQYTQLGTCILGPILSAAHTRSPISIVSAKCRLQDSCNSARCAQHAHAHTTPRVSTARC
jgi:hypothetical protein